MCLKRAIDLTIIMLKMSFNRAKMFKADSIMGIISSVTYLSANILFWVVVMTAPTFALEGWSFQNIVMFIAFSELFFGLDGAAFTMSSRFWRVIYSGSLDALHTRPMDSRLRFIIVNIDFVKIVTAFISFMILILVSGVQIVSHLPLLVIGFIFVVLSNIVLSLMRLTLSYAAFWLGKMDALSEVADCLTWFNKYPLVNVPGVASLLFRTILPFYFFSTFPTEVSAGMLSHSDIVLGLLFMSLCIVFWVIIHGMVWKRGLRKYESVNG
ncbi:MAG: ABC transporter permease [Defluviitaleaceae bacterium]|nr:ABC transporter permease [Defluviitaleaceae bacterium]